MTPYRSSLDVYTHPSGIDINLHNANEKTDGQCQVHGLILLQFDMGMVKY